LLRDSHLIELIISHGPDVVEKLPKNVKKNKEAVAETIDNNVRKLIINETPIDPAYYEKMSQLLDALIEQRREGSLSYQEYLKQIAALTKDVKNPGGKSDNYPAGVDTGAQRALFNNLGEDKDLALAVDTAIQSNRMDGWKTSPMKTRKVKLAIRAVLNEDEKLTDDILELAKNQNEY
jgi:type I restriction enzyme, R subunit